MVSAVLLVQSSNPNTITEFHDQISNELPMILGKWKFELKIFKNNPFLVAPTGTDRKPSENKFLYTLQLSYLHEKIISLVNDKVAIFSTAASSSLDTHQGSHKFDISSEHVSKGATIGINDPFDYLVTQKLQSLWNFRQLIKGEGGQAFSLENGSISIRTANCFLHGALKGFLIEIELTDPNLATEAESVQLARIRETIERYNVPHGRLSLSIMNPNKPDRYADLCSQYIETLNF